MQRNTTLGKAHGNIINVESRGFVSWSRQLTPIQVPKGKVPREICGHAPIENFEIKRLWNAISFIFCGDIWFCIRSKHQEYFKRIAKSFFNFSLTAVEYLKTYTTLSHHAPPPPLLATALAVLRQDSEGSVLFQKTCVFPELFFNTYTVKHYFPNSRQFSNLSSQIFSRWPALTESYLILSSMCLVYKVVFVIAPPTPCVSSSESRIICHAVFL